MAYLRTYFLGWAYMEPQRQAETHRYFTRRVYDALWSISIAGNIPREVRIMQLQLLVAIDWGNFHNVRFFAGARSAWYMVIHDIIPTNMRLHRTRLMDTENYTHCGRQDTMLYRLTESGIGKEIWERTRTQIAQIQRTDPRRISTDWLLRPCFKTWPRQRHRSILWFLTHTVVYQVNQRRALF
jgi:hypothetical protein